MLTVRSERPGLGYSLMPLGMVGAIVLAPALGVMCLVANLLMLTGGVGVLAMYALAVAWRRATAGLRADVQWVDSVLRSLAYRPRFQPAVVLVEAESPSPVPWWVLELREQDEYRGSWYVSMDGAPRGMTPNELVPHVHPTAEEETGPLPCMPADAIVGPCNTQPADAVVGPNETQPADAHMGPEVPLPALEEVEAERQSIDQQNAVESGCQLRHDGLLEYKDGSLHEVGGIQNGVADLTEVTWGDDETPEQAAMGSPLIGPLDGGDAVEAQDQDDRRDPPWLLKYGSTTPAGLMGPRDSRDPNRPSVYEEFNIQLQSGLVEAMRQRALLDPDAPPVAIPMADGSLVEVRVEPVAEVGVVEPVAEAGAVDPYDRLSYRELQGMCKDRKLPARGKREVLLRLLWDADRGHKG